MSIADLDADGGDEAVSRAACDVWQQDAH